MGDPFIIPRKTKKKQPAAQNKKESKNIKRKRHRGRRTLPSACGAKNQKIKDRIQRKRLLRKKTDDLRCKIKRLKEKQKMQQDYWERKYISPSTKGKEFPLVNPLLFISTMTPHLSFLNASIIPLFVIPECFYQESRLFKDKNF